MKTVLKNKYPAAGFARNRQKGLTLVELMVAMLVGLIVIGALFSVYLATFTSSQHSRALSQLTDDATLALNILSADVSQAGYSAATGINPDLNRFIRPLPGRSIFGCDDTFSNTTATIDTLVCGGGGNASIAVAYQADGFNAPVSAGVPLDCLGNALTADAAGRFFNNNKYYLAIPAGASLTALYCAGVGGAAGTAGQALVDNVVEMNIRYGIDDPATEIHQAVRYVTATDLAGNFDDVVTARICIVVASATEIMEAATRYNDCSGAQVTPTDRRLYRLFTTTVILHNRL